jgi:hypothetical protein
VNYWKVIFATAVIFGAGVFTGGLLVNYVHLSNRNAAHHPATTTSSTNSTASVSNAPVRLPDVMTKQFLPKLDDLLHLSSDQHKAIEKILAEGSGQMRKVMQDTRMNIRAELTPEQRSRFDEIMKRPGKKAANTNAVENLSVTNKEATNGVPAATPEK